MTSILVLLFSSVRAWTVPSTTTTPKRQLRHYAVSGDADLLVRAARGEETERTPVWLMRQAGRYMKDFRKFQEKYPFRVRSETPEIATELSLQCWKAFGVDGVIMFSDILTPFPALGIDFDVIPKKGPAIADTLRSPERIAAFETAVEHFSPGDQLPFVGETLRNLREETRGKTSLVGFVGAPWTLVGYAVEGGSNKNALMIKQMMLKEPELAHRLLKATADAVATYASHQIENGAQIIQLFESWAHHLNPVAFEKFAKPYSKMVAEHLKEKHPDTPVIFFANGGSSYLQRQKSLIEDGPFSALSIDWQIDMDVARSHLGPDIPVQGNVDPTLLLGDLQDVDDAVKTCIANAGGPGNNHILNLGHGVLQETPEAHVKHFVDAAKRYGVRE